MAKLTASGRRGLPKSDFAEPGKRAFPMNDRTHTREAISGASRSFNAGNISAGERDRIQAAARRKLAK